MATTFHQFGVLPVEVRLQVWECNLRSADPAFHVFSIKSRATSTASNGLGHKTPTQVHQCETYVLSNPTYTPRQRCPWSESDPSTYRVDAGLWSACKESRDVVQKHYATLVNPSSGHSSSTRHNQPERSASGSSILPDKDLIIFQVALDTYVSVGDALSALRPFFQNDETRLLHIAFEFTDDWDIQPTDDIKSMINQPGPRACFIRLLERTMCGLLSAKLYLLDYGSKVAEAGSPVLFSAGGYDLSEIEWTPTPTAAPDICAARYFTIDLSILGLKHWAFFLPMWAPDDPMTLRPFVHYSSSIAKVAVLRSERRTQGDESGCEARRWE
ncbi:hypothetical protein CNYM01_12774 [Colletotrichum nymphaeae SA-01]|uniref:2EXR domain-containing protein n=1 Tax=Colletotrichum nymphaeae SA-01 TaxID=1460502 RepID=A0A135S1W5_9PEZI|nr:hypothetical protein CNYM01_12774 [Colletotrichum nymphaeae SA-01]